MGPTLIGGVEVEPTIVEIKPPFTIEFDVTRQFLQQANTGSFRIFNLSEDTRRKLYKDDFRPDIYKGVQLDAGYGDVIPTIFKGNASHAWSVREGTNFISKVEAFDGGDALVSSNISQTFAKNTPQLQLADAVLDTMKSARVTKGAFGKIEGKLPRGNSLNGNSADILSNISKGGFFIDLERAYILSDNEVLQGAFRVIDSDTGLLGTPIRSNTKLSFDMLFEPRVFIGQEVELRSSTEKNFSGVYKVCAIRHSGTISDSVAGNAITTLTLWQGTESFTIVNP